MKYYSLKNILSKHCIYNVIIGERSNGKTYSVLEYGIKHYFKTGGQLAIIRRWKEDITGRRASEIFSAINQNNLIPKLSNGEYQGITYWSGKYYLCTYDIETGKPIYNLETDCIAHIFSLSDTEHNKSISFPKVQTILFDEFLTKGIYLHDEFILFMNTVSTIVRQRDDVTIFMCGNTVNKYSPYFEEMGLTHVHKMEQGTIDVYSYGNTRLKVAVEYCSSISKNKESNFYFAFNNPKLEMIKTGAWELDIYPHLPYKYKPKDVKFRYFIEFNYNLYQCEIIKHERDYFTYIHKKTTELKNPDRDIVYTLEKKVERNYNSNIYKPMSDKEKRILWFFKYDRVFYQNNEVGDAINNFLKICKREV